MRIPVRAALVAAAACALLAGCQKIPFRLELDELVNPSLAWHKAADTTLWGARRNHAAVVFGTRMYVVGGGSGVTKTNAVYSTTDGTSWSLVLADSASPPPSQFPQRANHAVAAHAGKLWCMAGQDAGNTYLQDIWSSLDGSTWAKLVPVPDPAWSPRYKLAACSTDTTLYVLGGFWYDGSWHNENDTRASNGGGSWTQQTAAAWSTGGRFGHTAVVFNGKLWVLGGATYNGTTYTPFKEVWSSADGGATWTQAPAPPWAGRWDHTSVVWDNRMWVICGRTDATTPVNDVWYTSDGASWQQLAVPSELLPRFGHASAVFDDKIWILGGTPMDGAATTYSDVWYYGIP
jgi:hypothetical protein